MVRNGLGVRWYSALWLFLAVGSLAMLCPIASEAGPPAPRSMVSTGKMVVGSDSESHYGPSRDAVDSDGDGLTDECEHLIAREFIPVYWFDYQHWSTEARDLHHVIAFDVTRLPDSALFTIRVTNFYKVDHGKFISFELPFDIYSYTNIIEDHEFDAEGYIMLVSGNPADVGSMSLISARTAMHENDYLYIEYWVGDIDAPWETSDLVFRDEIVGTRWGRMTAPWDATEHDDGILVSLHKNGSYVHKDYLDTCSMSLVILDYYYECGERNFPSTWVSPFLLTSGEYLASPVTGIEKHALLLPYWQLAPARVQELQTNNALPTTAIPMLRSWFKSAANGDPETQWGWYCSFKTDRDPNSNPDTLDATNEMAPVALNEKAKTAIPAFFPIDIALPASIPQFLAYRDEDFGGEPVFRYVLLDRDGNGRYDRPIPFSGGGDQPCGTLGDQPGTPLGRFSDGDILYARHLNLPRFGMLNRTGTPGDYSYRNLPANDRLSSFVFLGPPNATLVMSNDPCLDDDIQEFRIGPDGEPFVYANFHDLVVDEDRLSCLQIFMDCRDDVPPLVACPENATVECDMPSDPGMTGFAVGVGHPDSCDQEPVVSFHDVESPGRCPQEKLIDRTWAARDRYGNEAICIQTIMVVDTTPPWITCPADVTITCGEPTDPSATGFATATDTCDDQPATTFADAETRPACAADPIMKWITRTWTATDACGNSSSCDQVITVLKIVESLDIKPGSCPNSYNRGAHGVLPVGLLGTPSFDVTSVCVATVRLSRADCVGEVVAPHEGPPGPHSVISDVGTPFAGQPCGCHAVRGDGIADLLMFFQTDEAVPALQLDALGAGTLVELVVTGTLTDGCEFIARDCVRLVPPTIRP